MDPVPPEEQFRQPGALDHDKFRSRWSGHHILAYVLFGMLGLAIVAGLYYHQVSSLTNNYVAPEHKATDTSTWKTYTNNKFGYEFKYPSDHTIYSGINQNTETFIAATNSDSKVAIADNEKLLFCCEANILSFENVKTDLAPKEWIEGNYKRYSDEPGIGSVKEIDFAGRSAAEFTGAGDLGSVYKLIAVLYPDKSGLLVISEGSKSNNFDQILSTFKFTNDTSALKTYTNSQYGFEFSYPSKVNVGLKSTSSVLGDANHNVPGIFVGQYVFVIADTSELKKAAASYFDAVSKIPAKSPPTDGPTVECKVTTIKNMVSIQIVDCTGEGGPATYGLIKGANYDIFIDGYSGGWEKNPEMKEGFSSEADFIKTLESFNFTK